MYIQQEEGDGAFALEMVRNGSRIPPTKPDRHVDPVFPVRSSESATFGSSTG